MKSTKIISKLLPLLLLTLWVLPMARAELNLPDQPKTYVSDLAGLLDFGQKQNLEKALSQLEKNSSNQVLVVTVPDLQGLPVEDYAIALAEKWKPGQKDRDNGVILLVAPKERKVRIEVGYGLEGALPDATAKSIIEDHILPDFRRGDFTRGIFSGVAAIEAAIKGEYEALAPGEKPSNPYAKLLGFVLALVALIVIDLINRRRRAFGHDSTGWHVMPFFLGGGSGRSSGGSSWGGGGFSGGGGGFGGGGASGGW